MDGLFTAPEKLVLLWCPGLSGLVAGVFPGCRWVPPGSTGVPLDTAGVLPGLKRPAEVFAAHSIWDEFE